MPRPRNHPELPSLLQTRFTDREDHLRIFGKYLETVTGPLPALMFYGVGGIGKSWLLRQLRSRLTGAWQVPSVLIDFTKETGSNPFLADPLLILAELRTISSAPCPRFDMAFTLALVRRFRQDESALQNKITTSGISAGWELIKAGGGAVNPVLGGALAVLEKGYGLIKDKAILRTIHQRLAQDFAALSAKDLPTIESELVWRLAEDLNAPGALPQRSGYHVAQGVVFVDTLEALIPAGMSESDEERASGWLRDLITELRGRVLFVMAGQNKLEWEFLHSDWNDRAWLEQHVLGGLSASDSCEYFVRCGITDPAVHQAMLDHCLRVGAGGYYTASLGLLADIAWLEARRGGKVTPALFAEVDPSDMASLVRRFLKSLPTASDQDWIRRLAATPAFDQKAARAAHSAHWSQSQDTSWEMLTGLSFLTSSPTEAGWYSIHSTVQDALRQSGQLPREWHEKWRDYWQSRLAPAAAAQTEQSIGGTRLGDADADDVAYALLSDFGYGLNAHDLARFDSVEAGLAWFHHWCLDRVQARQSWSNLASDARRNLNMHLHHALLGWWTPTGVAAAHARTEDDANDLMTLGYELWSASLGSRSATLRQAIACFENALHVFTRESHPTEWAGLQNNLGLVHSELPDADRGRNLRSALAYFQNALEIYTPDETPSEWAKVQNNMGMAYNSLPDRERGANLRRAIACYESAIEVHTFDLYPKLWALSQNNLGIAYTNLPDGDRAANLRTAIEAFRNAQQVYTRDSHPFEWARGQNNLGVAYNNLPDGDRGENLRAAIECYRNALAVYSRDEFPNDWAMSQNNLGNALSELPDGDRSADLRQAIGCFHNAMEVCTREAHPVSWAVINHNLGVSYHDLPDGDRAENLRNAIAAYERSLEVYTRESFPSSWARMQNSLGNAYGELETDANVREAIAYYHRALEVYTRDGYPDDWALTRHNLGLTLLKSPDGDPADNLRQAIALFESSLEVYTPAAFPVDHGNVLDALGHAFEKHAELDPDNAAALLQRAAGYFRRAIDAFKGAGCPRPAAKNEEHLARIEQKLSS